MQKEFKGRVIMLFIHKNHKHKQLNNLKFSISTQKTAKNPTK